jgi:hypothetical protein
MAHDVARMHARYEAAIEMQVGAADRAACHLDDGVAIILNNRVVTSSQRMSPLPCQVKAFMSFSFACCSVGSLSEVYGEPHHGLLSGSLRAKLLKRAVVAKFSIILPARGVPCQSELFDGRQPHSAPLRLRPRRERLRSAATSLWWVGGT